MVTIRVPYVWGFPWGGETEGRLVFGLQTVVRLWVGVGDAAQGRFVFGSASAGGALVQVIEAGQLFGKAGCEELFKRHVVASSESFGLPDEVFGK